MSIILITIPTHLEYEKLKFKAPKNVRFLVTGIGSLVTYSKLMEYFIKHNKPLLIIQAGIAGSISDSLKIGDVALVTQDCLADLGLYDDQKNWLDIFKSDFMASFPKFYQHKFLKNPFLKNFAYLQLPKATAATVQSPSITKPMLSRLKQYYEADLESMEGAGLHFFGLQHKIPFLQIRAISNKAGHYKKKDWNIKLATDNLKLTLQNFCHHLK